MSETTAAASATRRLSVWAVDEWNDALGEAVGGGVCLVRDLPREELFPAAANSHAIDACRVFPGGEIVLIEVRSGFEDGVPVPVVARIGPVFGVEDVMERLGLPRRSALAA